MDACADGACQILVTGPVDVAVRDEVLVGSAPAGGGYRRSTMGRGGSSTFGSTSTTITVTVRGRTADGAVLGSYCRVPSRP